YVWNRHNWQKWSWDNGGRFVDSNDPNMPPLQQLCPSPPAYAGAIHKAPVLPQPSLPGDLVAVRVQNAGSDPEAAGYVSYAQTFVLGAVMPADPLVARIGGANVLVQSAPLATNPDGSVRHAILTFAAPGLASRTNVDAMIAKGTAAPPTQVA